MSASLSTMSISPKAPPNESTALLFAGQGAQTVGMTREQLAIPAISRMYEVANEALGYDVKQIVLEGVWCVLINLMLQSFTRR